VKLHWLLPGTFGTIFMLSSPAIAARLESWRFDANENRLSITTSGAVQPKAEVVFNPTRLVVDLPNTTFGRPQLSQAVEGGKIRSIRVGQFNQDTTRIVIELAYGFTLDPNQVKFVGTSASRWTVQLPTPQTQRAQSSPRIYSAVTVDSAEPGFSKVANNATTGAGATQIENVRITGDGFFVRTSGINPNIRVNRSGDRSTINMEISQATLSPSMTQRNFPVNQHGVSRVEFTQLETRPPAVRMTLRVDKDSPDWRATASSAGGLVVLPLARLGKLSNVDNQSPPSNNSPRPFAQPSESDNNSVATIQSVELSGGGSQLTIRGDKNLSATGGWDRSSSLFRITIANAKLSPSVKGPVFDVNSPILRLRLQQIDPRTVAIYIQPAARVQIGEINQVGQLLALQLQRKEGMLPPFTPPGSGLPPLPRPNPLPFPGSPIDGSISSPRQQVPNGRGVVIIDPGHGGNDPGAIGIGGLQEKNIILPISQRVAQILQQNGLQVVMTRNSDFFVTLQGRVDMAERANADVFVSIHANSVGLGRPDVSGLEVYYYDSGVELARVVKNNILQSVNVRDRGIRRARFFVLRKTSMPSILVETGYVTGQEDAAKLRDPQYQNQMAEGIARGILQYLGRR
jgi:N-acetylmuramoyl-L-alanine amidase